MASEVLYLNGLKVTSLTDLSMLLMMVSIRIHLFLNVECYRGLFIIFIIFTTIFLMSELLFTVLYADDTCVLLGVKDLENIISCLNNELKNISTWLKANKLSLNV